MAGCLRPQPEVPTAPPGRGLSLRLFDAERSAKQSAPADRTAGSATPAQTVAQAPVYAPATPTPFALARSAAAPPAADRALTVPYAPAAVPTSAARFPSFDLGQIFQPLASATPAVGIGQTEMLALPRPGDPPPPGPALIVPPPVAPAAVVVAPPRSVAAPEPVSPDVSYAVQSVPAQVVVAVTAAPTETPPSTSTVEPTAPPLPTVTPTLPPTSTPAPSATVTTCAGDERLSFDPGSPVSGGAFTAAARSIRAHVYVGLEGPGNPQFTGAAREGQINVWRWQVTAGSAGAASYNFVVDGRICASGSVQVQAPIPTATATPALLPDPGRSAVSASAARVAPGVAVYLYVSVRNAAGQPLVDRLVGVSGGRAADQIGQPSRTGPDGVAAIAVTLGLAGTSSFVATDLGTGSTLGQVTVTAVDAATNTPAPPSPTPTAAGPTATVPPATAVPGAPTSTPRPAATATPRSPAPTFPGGG